MLANLVEIAEGIAPHINRTPLIHSRTLSELLGVELYLKAELFQKTGSYKPRGMLNRLTLLSKRERDAGVVTFSAGNAAQGLAYASRIIGTHSVVVMPESASPSKIAASRAYGADVVLRESTAECIAHSRLLSERDGLTFISSYDDLELMKGHASLGLEIINDLPSVETILLGIGGGGMAGGIAMAKEATDSDVSLIGVEPEGAAAAVRSIEAGRPITLDKVDTIADGLAAPSTGQMCFPFLRDIFSDVIAVSDTSIREAMLLLMTRAKLFAEPAGAAGLAAAISRPQSLKPGSTVVCIVSGGNMDPRRLKQLL